MVFKLNFVITIVEKHLKHLGTDFFFFFLTKESQSQGNFGFTQRPLNSRTIIGSQE